jgi:hypothetical protein
MTFTLRASKSFCLRATSPSSVVQTGVKSLSSRRHSQLLSVFPSPSVWGGEGGGDRAGENGPRGKNTEKALTQDGRKGRPTNSQAIRGT